jgi:hypothetical protein
VKLSLSACSHNGFVTLKKLTFLPIFIILALILLAVLGIGLCLRDNKRNPKNLRLMTVDTLRADRLSLYGCPRNTSPELDKRATNAMVFDHALCQWPKTVPSMVSIFSSTYPHTNGILFGSRGQWVEDRILMFPEIMKEHGYKTRLRESTCSTIIPIMELQA